MSTFKCKVVTYNKVFFDGEASAVTIPALDGELQVLANHEACVVGITPGQIEITDASGKKIGGVCGSGFLEFLTEENMASILVDTIELPEEIDVRRAQEAKERAEEELRQKKSIMEYYHTEAALARALARLKVSGKSGKI